MAINEFTLIERYFKKEFGGFGVALGIGDDCALLQAPADKSLAVTVDTLVAGNHFPQNADPELIAERALRVNLSDLAAMGAEPLWFTLALTLPDADEHWLDGFSRGLFQAAHLYHCSLVGGDITRGPLSITIQAMGAVPLATALQRGNAEPGDRIYVTGPLGDAAAAVAVIKGELSVGSSAFNYFMSRYYRPLPKLAEGALLRGVASAAIDISDGLLADLGHICKASGVGAHIALEQVPVSEALSKLASPQQVNQWALAGGDDYHLCFTVPRSRQNAMNDLIRRHKINAIAIGDIVPGEGVTCTYEGHPFHLKTTGYQHFE